MKVFGVLIGVVVVILLCVIAYQINRTTWSPEDQACYSMFSDQTKDETCRLAYQNKQWAKKNLGN